MEDDSEDKKGFVSGKIAHFMNLLNNPTAKTSSATTAATASTATAAPAAVPFKPKPFTVTNVPVPAALANPAPSAAAAAASAVPEKAPAPAPAPAPAEPKTAAPMSRTSSLSHYVAEQTENMNKIDSVDTKPNAPRPQKTSGSPGKLVEDALRRKLEEAKLANSELLAKLKERAEIERRYKEEFLRQQEKLEASEKSKKDLQEQHDRVVQELSILKISASGDENQESLLSLLTEQRNELLEDVSGLQSALKAAEERNEEQRKDFTILHERYLETEIARGALESRLHDALEEMSSLEKRAAMAEIDAGMLETVAVELAEAKLERDLARAEGAELAEKLRSLEGVGAMYEDDQKRQHQLEQQLISARETIARIDGDRAAMSKSLAEAVAAAEAAAEAAAHAAAHAAAEARQRPESASVDIQTESPARCDAECSTDKQPEQQSPVTTQQESQTEQQQPDQQQVQQPEQQQADQQQQQKDELIQKLESELAELRESLASAQAELKKAKIADKSKNALDLVKNGLLGKVLNNTTNAQNNENSSNALEKTASAPAAAAGEAKPLKTRKLFTVQQTLGDSDIGSDDEAPPAKTGSKRGAAIPSLPKFR